MNLALKYDTLKCGLYFDDFIFRKTHAKIWFSILANYMAHNF